MDCRDHADERCGQYQPYFHVLPPLSFCRVKFRASLRTIARLTCSRPSGAYDILAKYCNPSPSRKHAGTVGDIYDVEQAKNDRKTAASAQRYRVRGRTHGRADRRLIRISRCRAESIEVPGPEVSGLVAGLFIARSCSEWPTTSPSWRHRGSPVEPFRASTAANSPAGGSSLVMGKYIY